MYFCSVYLKKGRLLLYQIVESFYLAIADRQISTGEHSIQPVLVFHQSPMHCFPVAELTLDDPECMLHFAAHRGFTILNIPFLVDSVVTGLGKTAGTAFDAEINLFEVCSLFSISGRFWTPK